MKHDKFIKRWKKSKKEGFKRYVVITASTWTLIMFPILKALYYYSSDVDPFNFAKLWWQLPMFFMSGICYALVSWIVNNYLYAKYTGEFTPENHHHHHD